MSEQKDIDKILEKLENIEVGITKIRNRLDILLEERNEELEEAKEIKTKQEDIETIMAEAKIEEETGDETNES